MWDGITWANVWYFLLLLWLWVFRRVLHLIICYLVKKNGWKKMVRQTRGIVGKAEEFLNMPNLMPRYIPGLGQIYKSGAVGVEWWGLRFKQKKYGIWIILRFIRKTSINKNVAYTENMLPIIDSHSSGYASHTSSNITPL